MQKPKWILLLLLIFNVAAMQAQSLMVRGFLRDSITHYPITGGTITNENSRKSVKTDGNGFFRIEAAPNDFIYAIALSYQYDTLRYSILFTDTIVIYLAPTGDLLPTITV